MDYEGGVLGFPQAVTYLRFPIQCNFEAHLFLVRKVKSQGHESQELPACVFTLLRVLASSSCFVAISLF